MRVSSYDIRESRDIPESKITSMGKKPKGGAKKGKAISRYIKGCL